MKTLTCIDAHDHADLFDEIVGTACDDQFGPAMPDPLDTDGNLLTGFSSIRIVDRAGRDPAGDSFDYECRDARRVTLATLDVDGPGLTAGGLRRLIHAAYTLEGLKVVELRDQFADQQEWRPQEKEAALARRLLAELSGIGAVASPSGLTFGMIGLRRGETNWWIEGSELLVEVDFDGAL